MILGFTGTRLGMTEFQRANVMRFLRRLGPEAVHHGDCIGADWEFHRIAQRQHIWTIIHPPVKDRHRAFCGGSFCELRSPRPYLDRNQDIVNASDHLLGTPRQDHEIIRSGTWATVRRARDAGVPTTIFGPEGGEIE